MIFRGIADLIAQLSSCAKAADFCDFQRELLAELLSLEAPRGKRACIRRRLTRGEQLLAKHHDLDGRDLQQTRTWAFELGDAVIRAAFHGKGGMTADQEAMVEEIPMALGFRSRSQYMQDAKCVIASWSPDE